MPANETVLYRGARFELGRGPGFYGIWPAGAPRPSSIEWWPDSPEGWQGAWSRFTGLETPASIAAVSVPTAGPEDTTGGPAQPGTAVPGGPPGATTWAAPPGATTWAAPPGATSWASPPGATAMASTPGASLPVTRARTIVAAALLAVGTGCGIASLFPAYYSAASVAQQPAQLVLHAIFLAVWTASALLILRGGAVGRVGALLALGTSIVTFGFFFADAGTGIAGGGRVGAGLVLGLIGWLTCAAGSAAAFRFRLAAALGKPDGPARGRILRLALATAAALGAAIAFAPSWDSYTLRTTSGQIQSQTAGNAFANPGLVIFGNVAVMVLLVVVVAAAAWWRPVRLGAMLLAGATIPMVAQAISAMVLAGEAVSPAQFGISPAQAAQAGLTISPGLTPVFWVYCAFVLALAVTCGWMLFAPRRPVPAVFPAGPAPSAPPAPPAEPAGPAGQADSGPAGPLSPSLG